MTTRNKDYLDTFHAESSDSGALIVDRTSLT